MIAIPTSDKNTAIIIGSAISEVFKIEVRLFTRICRLKTCYMILSDAWPLTSTKEFLIGEG